MSRLTKQILRFAVVGTAAFFIDFGLLVFLTEVFGLNYLISATISFTASVVFNYVVSMRFIFTHKEGMSRKKEMFLFVLFSVIGLILNTIGMWVGVDIMSVDYRITKIVVTLLVTGWNFGSRKIWLDGGE